MVLKLPMLDAFSGMGGFSYALRSLYRTCLYCEIDPNCQHVLECLMKCRKLDSAPILPDIREIPSLPVSPILLTAGSPCLDLTIMSRTPAGIHGARSGLIFEIFNVLDKFPSIQAVFLENSPMIVSRGLEEVVTRLEARGFQMAWGVFSAREVGAPHLRRRWYCLAVKTIKLPMLRMGKRNNLWDHERIPRVLEKTRTSMRELSTRAQVIGNSVVPQCVRCAYNSLNSALQGKLSPSKVSNASILVFADGCTSHFHRPLVNITMPDVNLLVEYVEHSQRYSSWSTPIRNIYAGINETVRAARMLATQILHDRATLEYVHRLTGMHVTTKDMNRSWTINPDFIEWLMGYPPGWTRCAVVSPR